MLSAPILSPFAGAAVLRFPITMGKCVCVCVCLGVCCHVVVAVWTGILPLTDAERSLATAVGKGEEPYLRDTLPVLSPVEDSPSNAAGVLSLQEERLGFALLESEDLVVTTDVEFSLRKRIPLVDCRDYGPLRRPFPQSP